MRAVSARYLASLPGSSITRSRVRVVNPFNRDGAGAWNNIGPALPVLAGTVVLDGTADLRMRIDGLQVAARWPDTGQDVPNTTGQFHFVADAEDPGREVWPFRRTNRPGAFLGAFSPHGNLLQVEAGVEFGGGEVEYVRLGYVRIDELDQQDAPDGPIDVTVSDLSAFIQDGRPEFDKTYPAGTTMLDLFTDAITAYRGKIRWAVPTDLDLDPTFAASTLGAAATMDRESFAFLADLVQSRGCIWYWDSRGKLVVKPQPSSAGDPVWDLYGGEGGTATRLGRKITRDGVANVWVVDGDAVTATNPVRYVIWNDGDSASYWAFFGQVTQFYSSPFITTDAGAQSAAETLVRNNPGVPYRVTADHVANAALEPYDVVRAWVYGRGDPQRYELHQVETTSIPLVGDQGGSTMRERFL